MTDAKEEERIQKCSALREEGKGLWMVPQRILPPPQHEGGGAREGEDGWGRWL